MDFYNEKENIDYSVNNNSVLANDESSLLDEKETTSIVENACSKVDTLSKVNVTTTSSCQRTSRSSSTSSSSISSSSSSESSSSDKGECSTKPLETTLFLHNQKKNMMIYQRINEYNFILRLFCHNITLDMESSKTQRGATVNNPSERQRSRNLSLTGSDDDVNDLSFFLSFKKSCFC